jgi:hypothetical protein
MKKVILFVLVISLMGCEKYELTTPPVITGGKWVFYDYDIVPVSSISSYQIIKNDTICINSWNNQTFVSGGILMKQNFDVTTKDRRFIRGKTTWEFNGTVGSPFYYLSTDFMNFNGSLQPSHTPFEVELHDRVDKISVYNTETGGLTWYTYEINNVKSNGVTPLSKMTLLGPEVVTDLYMSNGTRDKAVTVRVLLRFMR